VRCLLVSTYELGHQPLGCIGPARALLAAGHEVRLADLAVEPWPAEALAWCDRMILSVPMHTALRLGSTVVDRARASRPDLPVALHGLYAGVARDDPRWSASDLVAASEAVEPLLEWLDDGEGGAVAEPAAVRGTSAVDAVRASLPPLGSYAQLIEGERRRLAGSVAASFGCAHRCRHCPVPVLYDGRTKPIELELVLADVAALIEMGAEHISFADPDFLNRPWHGLRVVRQMAERFPGTTFDATVKVEHILRHRTIWPELASKGCRFVVSALESTNDAILARLDKGHTTAEAIEAIDLLRDAGIEPRPSFLPFTPWTTLDDLVVLLNFVEANDLVYNTEPVQYGIRLLIPPGSLLLKDPDPALAASLTGFDRAQACVTWSAPDPRLDDLAAAISAAAERAAELQTPIEVTFAEIRSLVTELIERRDAGRASGPSCASSASAARPSSIAGPERPRLSEAWFCCAEPTALQLGRLSDRGRGSSGSPATCPAQPSESFGAAASSSSSSSSSDS
jgi:hypothetical protein